MDLSSLPLKSAALLRLIFLFKSTSAGKPSLILPGEDALPLWVYTMKYPPPSLVRMLGAPPTPLPGAWKFFEDRGPLSLSLIYCSVLGIFEKLNESPFIMKLKQQTYAMPGRAPSASSILTNFPNWSAFFL